jgi:hypothetical protein
VGALAWVFVGALSGDFIVTIRPCSEAVKNFVGALPQYDIVDVVER